MFIICGGILYLLLLLFTLHMGCIKPEYENNPIKIMQLAMEHIQEKPLAILPFTSYSFVYSMVGTCIFGIIMLYAYLMVIRRDTDKDAGGSAKWNTDMKAYNKKYNTPFGSPETNGPDNMILAKDLYMSMNGSKTRRNCHQVVFGGSGAGKSYSLVKPNGLQMNCSYVFTDPKGKLIEELAIKIKLKELIEIAKSVDEARAKGCDEISTALYYDGFNDGHSKALDNLWQLVISKYDDGLSLEELAEEIERQREMEKNEK